MIVSHRQLPVAALAASLAAGLSTALPAAAQPPVTAELNKLEAIDGGCRSFFLFRNRSETAYSAFEMALAILDTDGIIDRLLTIDAAPLPAGRTTLKLFEIEGIACDRIGELIVHDMPVCTPQDGSAAPDCFGLVDLVSRAAAALVK